VEGFTSTCVNTPGSFLCNTTGVDINECNDPGWAFGCAAPVEGYTPLCVNTVGSFVCNVTGIDVNECATLDVACPAARSSCVNTRGSFECPCDTGFARNAEDDSLPCVNIDECAVSTACPPWQVCVDTIGAFECHGASPTSSPTESPTPTAVLLDNAGQSNGSSGGWMPEELSWMKIIVAVVALAVIVMIIAIIVVRRRRKRRSGRASMTVAKTEFANPVFVHPAPHSGGGVGMLRTRSVSSEDQEFALVQGALDMMQTLDSNGRAQPQHGSQSPSSHYGQPMKYASPTGTIHRGPGQGHYGSPSSPSSSLQQFTPHTSHARGYTNHSKVRTEIPRLGGFLSSLILFVCSISCHATLEPMQHSNSRAR
jgi:hypothetical protein